MRETADFCDSICRRTNGPIPSASKMFAILFLASGFLLARRMREKLRSSAPLFVLSSDEIAAAVCVLASLAFHLLRLRRS
ncbi:hydroxymethylglutaryl-CoA reductase (NADPH) [Dendrobium catenatum]|uniref:Hydroxymethylglutaryl-CoA reductase (NADPH) n=1 Tax=Dendrobium catenatum TaxID=906689 RepID=A0A2I0XI39_9ASPA|nr:hydroxymethylglutaryl-CoA reductase (NADPH) [Dendrobium catenatum]